MDHFSVFYLDSSLFTDYSFAQVIRMDGGEYVSMAGEFNELKRVKRNAEILLA